jgi:UDP-glucose 4-epimerase
MGSNVVEKLLTAGYSVRVLDTQKASRSNLDSISSQIEFVSGNFLDTGDIQQALQQVEFVVHLAGTTLPASSNREPAFDVESNVIGTLRLLEACVRHSIKRIVFSSSGGTVYGEPRKIPIDEDHPTNPLCSYGISKLAIEKYLQLFHHLHGLDYTILRIANAYGRYQKLAAGQGAVGVFLRCIRDGEPITIWGDGSVTRDYIYVEDVATAFVKAISQNSAYRLFNIGTGIGLSLRNLVGKIEQITGIQPKVEYSSGRPIDVSNNVLDSMRANRFMNWHAETDCDTGLRKTWEWICANKPRVTAAQGL